MGKDSKRTEEIELQCPLTITELEEESQKLTMLTAEIEEYLKKEMKRLELGEPDRIKVEITSCIIMYNVPEPGKKSIMRISTGEAVCVDMTDDEKQDIFYNKEA